MGSNFLCLVSVVGFTTAGLDSQSVRPQMFLFNWHNLRLVESLILDVCVQKLVVWALLAYFQCELLSIFQVVDILGKMRMV